MNNIPLTPRGCIILLGIVYPFFHSIKKEHYVQVIYMELSIGLTSLAIIGLLILYGVSKIPEANRKYYEDLKSKKLNSNH